MRQVPADDAVGADAPQRLHMAGSNFRSRARMPAAVVAISLLLLAVGGQLAYHLDIRHSLAFFSGVFLVFYIPGSLLVSRVIPRQDWPVAHSILALAIGLTAFPLIYRILRQLDLNPMIVALIVVTQAAVWLVCRYRARLTPGTKVKPDLGELAGLGFLALAILVLLHFSHFGDVVFSGDGLAIRNIFLTESVFHLGLVNSLVDGFPPPGLYAAGTRDFAYYHLDMHLQMELIARLARVPTAQLASFYFPLVYLFLLGALPFVFVRTLRGSVALAAGCGLLVFGSGFSFIPGLLIHSDGQVWARYFPTTIWSIFTLNGYLPALMPLFAALVVLNRHSHQGGRAPVLVFALCAIGAYGLKASMGLHIAAAGVATGAFGYLVSRPNRQALLLLWVSLLTLAALLFSGLLLGSATDTISIRLAPFNLFLGTLQAVGLRNVDVVWYPVLLVLVLLGALGVRALGLWGIYDALRFSRPPEEVPVFLGAFFLVGYGASELLFIGRPYGLNNASWFFTQSLMGAWFALFWTLARCNWTGGRLAALWLALFLLAAPSTVQFLAHRSADQYAFYGRDELDVVDFLKTTDAHSVVLHPLNLDRPSLSANLAGRVSVLSPYLSFVMEEDGLSQRAVDVLRFFDEATQNSVRKEILRQYGVDYVYLPTEQVSLVSGLDGLELVLHNDSLTVFRVHPLVAPHQP